MSSLPFVRRSPFPAAGLISVLLLGAIAAAAAGCGGSQQAGADGGASAGSGDVLMAHGVAMTATEMHAAWEVRPAYVDQNGPATSEAYAYALTRPDVLQYMPCYCGCVAMDHRSNLDCFLRPRVGGTAIAFEEHASFCVVCVDTALLAKRLVTDGVPLAEIRAEVDRQFGGRAPGTDTELPAA